MVSLAYRKMNGLGNDFVVIDGRASPLKLTGDQVRWIADREQGVGADQIILLGRPSAAGIDTSLTIFNADGGEVSACGNASALTPAGGSFISAGGPPGRVPPLNSSGSGTTSFAPQFGQIARLPASAAFTLSLCPFGQLNRIPIGPGR